MKVLIATKNKGKIEGAKRAFEKFFDNVELIGISVDSNVSEQPVNDETLKGARNRIENLKKYSYENNLKADMFVAIESGITNQLGDWMIVNIAIIENELSYSSVAASPAFPVPDKLVEKIKTETLGKVMDEIFNKEDLRSLGGGIQLLTHGRVSRIDLTEAAFIMALTKFVNNEIWR